MRRSVGGTLGIRGTDCLEMRFEVTTLRNPSQLSSPVKESIGLFLRNADTRLQYPVATLDQKSVCCGAGGNWGFWNDRRSEIEGEGG